jgi:hypothetical protein
VIEAAASGARKTDDALSSSSSEAFVGLLREQHLTDRDTMRLRLAIDLPKLLRTISELSAAKARAMPKPIPLVDPVTSDTFPASTSRLLIFSGLMVMFMARLRPCRIADIPRCASTPTCPIRVMRSQCRLANGAIESCYGRALALRTLFSAMEW